MRTNKLIFLLIFLGIILVACQSGQLPASTVEIDQEALQTSSPTPPLIPQPTNQDPAIIAGQEPEPEVVNECFVCHSDMQKLIDTANPELAQVNTSKGLNNPSDLPAMEPWEKVLVDRNVFPTTVHGLIGCAGCHGGQQSPEKEIAHTGLVKDPSANAGGVCSQCHPHITSAAETSLHNNLKGYFTHLQKRGASPHKLDEIVNNNCSACHTSCSDCHISQPNVVGGGLIAGHNFNATPSMERSCTACHNAQVGNEYLGKHAGLLPDVHMSQGGLECVACHTGVNLHGQPDNCTVCHPGPESEQLPPADHRYAGVQQPSCESCHASVATEQDEILQHKLHGSKLSCQVCHAVDYASWDGSTFVTGENGDPEFRPGDMELTFMIGRNPIQSYVRPYEFVTVRHAPISTTTFDIFEPDFLKTFSRVETWQYATPHNIQRFTPQNSSCNYCHGNAAIFLTADKVSSDELEANKHVIVEQVPELITSADQIPDVFGP